MKVHLRFLIAFVLACGLFRMPAAADETLLPGQWSAEKAWAWYRRQPWLAGCNFLPSTAVNPLEMWSADTFDPEMIDRELGYAEQLGFNCMRVYLHYVAWQTDADGLKRRLDEYLTISKRHGIVTMLVLFDDCWKERSVVGPQPEPVPGVHNSQWTQSPGPKLRADVANGWPRLEAYVKDIVGAFGNDERIVVWDLYNEPGHAQRKGELCEAAFAWARETKPRQPITSSIFQYPVDLETTMIQYAQSDIVSFHDYRGIQDVKALVERLRKSGRPLICTEYMGRTKSTFSRQMAYFKQEGIAAINWGLVAGRMQTYRGWDTMNKPAFSDIRPGAAGGYDAQNWFHDILLDNGEPKYPFEAVLIRSLTGKAPFPRLLVPTSNLESVEWRFTEEPPDPAWMTPAFDDSGWSRGGAPFGIDFRGPATIWHTVKKKHLYARRDFAIPAGGIRAPRLWVMCIDSDAVVYVNGVEAARLSAEHPDHARNGGRDYAEVAITPAAAAAIRPGRNVIALDLRERNWPLVDVGLVAD